MKDAVVMIDGTLAPPDGAKVSVFDRGFLYGDSVFETLRTYGGFPFEIDAHLERLSRSAALVLIPLPVSTAELGGEVRRAIAARGNGEHWVRIMLTRGEGPLGLDPGVPLVAKRLVIVCPLQPLPSAVYESGVALSVFYGQRDVEVAGAAGAKYGNYLLSVLATRQARAEGAHEALIANREGRIAEGASSNLFFVKDGVLHTPPLSAGVLDGITRRQVLRAAENLGLSVNYTVPLVGDLEQADEVFISSSVREVVPAVRVGKAVIGAGQPGGVSLSIIAEFRRSVAAWCAAQR